MSMAITPQPRPRRRSANDFGPNSIGDKMVELWHLRYLAERDILSAIVQADIDLLPLARQIGVRRDLFVWDPYRLAWCVLNQIKTSDHLERLRWIYKAIAFIGTKHSDPVNQLDGCGRDKAAEVIRDLYGLRMSGGQARPRAGGLTQMQSALAMHRRITAAAARAKAMYQQTHDLLDAVIGDPLGNETTRGPGGHTGGKVVSFRKTA